MASIAVIDAAVVDPSPIVSQPLTVPEIDIAYESDVSEDLNSNASHVKEAFTKSEKGKLLKRRERHFSQTSDSEEGENEIEHKTSRLDFLAGPCKAAEHAEEFVKRVWEAGWRVVNHHSLPDWLQDNDFLHKGHRVPTNSFRECFKSIFRIHTETGNIWSHLLGMIAFMGIAGYFFNSSISGDPVAGKGKKVGKLFNKLDYCGIAILTMGSFVPWLYYSFYCRLVPKIAYLVLIFVLGTICIVVSLFDKFREPQFRGIRAGMFIALGLSGVIPALHFVISDGFDQAVNNASLGWLCLMAVLYIVGALIYAFRVPERIFPGKFDIWCQSHQIFHMFVLAAAFVHYHGITQIASYRLTLGDCLATDISS
ncbi:ADIPOR [Mytilus edulis]|uniref:ADIPOR n=1 Tax=Mytilus edulis TaxID=6550 RepID=A0A8S3QH89_MYTED|nr:ADIPOR [Mytilus edulis]